MQYPWTALLVRSDKAVFAAMDVLWRSYGISNAKQWKRQLAPDQGRS